MTRLLQDFSKSIKSCLPIRREEGESQPFSQSSTTSIETNKEGELETILNALFLL